MERSVLERYLGTYSLEEILDMNDLTEEEVLEVLVEQDLVRLPTRPVDAS